MHRHTAHTHSTHTHTQGSRLPHSQELCHLPSGSSCGAGCLRALRPGPRVTLVRSFRRPMLGRGHWGSGAGLWGRVGSDKDHVSAARQARKPHCLFAHARRRACVLQYLQVRVSCEWVADGADEAVFSRSGVRAALAASASAAKHQLANHQCRTGIHARAALLGACAPDNTSECQPAAQCHHVTA